MSIFPSASRRGQRPASVSKTPEFKELVAAIDPSVPSDRVVELIANFRNVVRAEASLAPGTGLAVVKGAIAPVVDKHRDAADLTSRVARVVVDALNEIRGGAA